MVLALGGILAGLAVLQYRWSGEVSQAASAQMHSSLYTSLMGFRQELSREFAAISLELQPAVTTESRVDPRQYAQRYQHWRQNAAHPSLVTAIDLWRTSDVNVPLLRLAGSDKDFQHAPWPANLERVHQQLWSMTGLVAQLVPLSASHRAFTGDVRHAVENRPTKHRSEWGIPWAVEGDVPALIYPIAEHPDQRSGKPAVTWMIVELNPAVLQRHILPELAERYFGGAGASTYQVAVVRGGSANARPEVVFASDAALIGGMQNSDGALNLWGPPSPPMRPGHSGAEMFRPMPRPPHDESSPSRHQDFGFNGSVRFTAFRYDDSSPQEWQLVARHRRGSVQAAVAALRRRNLAISFGVLLVLASTMALALIANHRARRLARLQMQFVAGISHELRTPLAVISSAADNIADGVVEDRQQVLRYGQVIRQQSRQLTQLVEQVLQFAADRRRRHSLDIRAIQVDQVIEHALENTAEVLSGAQVRAELHVASGLPAIAADFAALSHCLQNLITNAVKYGGNRRWIGIRAFAGTGFAGAPEVVIVVEDKGPGIAPGEKRRIFEPFYRSPWAIAAQIRGTGLGLSLARSIAEAMGARLTVTSEAGRGAAFAIHLPRAQELTPAPESTLDLQADARSAG